MRTISAMFMIAYVLAWWAAFWLPARKGRFAPLVFIPAAMCAFGIPTLVADTIRATPHGFLIVWSSIPFAVVALEAIWKMKKRNPNKVSLDIVANAPNRED